MPRLTFIRPLNPSAAVRPPKGDDWAARTQVDGFRFQIIKVGNAVRLYSRHGAEYTDRLPGMVEAFAKLPARAAILDGELRLMREMRTRVGVPRFSRKCGACRSPQRGPGAAKKFWW